MRRRPKDDPEGGPAGRRGDNGRRVADAVVRLGQRRGRERDPPKPDAQTQAAYIADLRAIDADIIGKKDEEKIVDRGRDQCRSIKDFPNDRAKLVDLTSKRFTSPNHPEGFGPAKAAKILDVVHKRLCPTYPMG